MCPAWGQDAAPITDPADQAPSDISQSGAEIETGGRDWRHLLLRSLQLLALEHGFRYMTEKGGAG